jgi:hypothetical protein
LTVGCGRNDGRAPCLEEAAGGEGEARLASLEGPSKRLSTVARGISEGEGDVATLRETSDAVGEGESRDVGTRGVVGGEGVHTGEVKAGSISNVNLIPSLSSSRGYWKLEAVGMVSRLFFIEGQLCGWISDRCVRRRGRRKDDARTEESGKTRARLRL